MNPLQKWAANLWEERVPDTRTEVWSSPWERPDLAPVARGGRWNVRGPAYRTSSVWSISHNDWPDYVIGTRGFRPILAIA